MAFYTLHEIEEAMCADPACALLEGARCHILGEGSGSSGVLFIGEAPGKDEDEQGRPFVGRSGKILRKLISEAGLTEEDVYITNVVKCRPPENRDPFPQEIMAYWPYLEAQIEILDPKLIVTLGRHSMGRFSQGLQISNDHGKVFRLESGRYFLPCYHPAVACYSPAMLDTLREDMLKIPKILAKL